MTHAHGDIVYAYSGEVHVSGQLCVFVSGHKMQNLGLPADLYPLPSAPPSAGDRWHRLVEMVCPGDPPVLMTRDELKALADATTGDVRTEFLSLLWSLEAAS